MDRRAAKIGGWAAIGAGVLSVALVGLVAIAQTSAQGRPAPAPDNLDVVAAHYPKGVTLALAFVRASFSVAVAACVYGVRATFASAARVGWIGALCGYLAALMLLLTSLLAPLFGPLHIPAWLNMVAYWAPLPLGMWLLITAAAAWKLDCLPKWLRVVAAVVGAFAFMQPAIPEAGLVVLVLGLLFWFGLGVSLLRDSRFPHAASASDTGRKP